MNGSLFFFSVLRPAGVMPDRFLSCRMPARYGAIGGALAGASCVFSFASGLQSECRRSKNSCRRAWNFVRPEGFSIGLSTSETRFATGFRGTASGYSQPELFFLLRRRQGVRARESWPADTSFSPSGRGQNPFENSRFISCASASPLHWIFVAWEA